MRALAALAAQNPQVRDVLIRDAMRGQDYFRSSVIEALGDYKVGPPCPDWSRSRRSRARSRTMRCCPSGKWGTRRRLAALAELQRTGAQVLQPSVASAICLLGQNCTSHLGFLQKTLGFAEDFPGYQDLIRSSAAGLGAIGASGNPEAVTMLLDIGVPSEDPLRAPVALALGLVALRNTPVLLKSLEGRKDRDRAVSLVARGLRHARGGSGGGAVLRHRAADLLGRPRPFSHAGVVRISHHQARFLRTETGTPIGARAPASDC